MATQFPGQFPGDQSGNVIARARRLLLGPAGEWAAIDAEPMSPLHVFASWAVPLAAIGPVATLVGSLLFGVGVLGFHYQPSLMMAVTTALASYGMALIGVWVIALAIDGLAPGFGGTRSLAQAMKVAAFSMTAHWLAAIFGIWPALAFLSLAGLYSLYLLYVGLPRLMKTGEDKALPYTAAVVLVAVVVMIAGGWIAGTIGNRFASPLTTVSALGGAGDGTRLRAWADWTPLD